MKDDESLQALIDTLSKLFSSDDATDLPDDGKQKKITIMSIQKGKGLKIPKAGKKEAKKKELEEDEE